MKLAIFGRDEDALSVHTADKARARGWSVLPVALADHAPAAFDGATWLWAGDEIEACDAFVVRRYPAVHAQLGPADETATGAQWWRRQMKQLERSTFAQSLIMDLELRGKPVINPLLASSPFEHKPLQLAAFRRAGLPIPSTLITNFPDAARIFESEHGRVIVKPIAGGAAALAVDDDVRARFDAMKEAPVIVQERVEGPDVRVTIVGGQVVSSVVVESDGGVDYRTGDAYARGDGRYVAHALSEDGARIALTAAGVCRHVLSGVDLKLRATGEYVLLEANSAPVYLDIERKCGHPITDAVLDWLSSSAARAGG